MKTSSHRMLLLRNRPPTASWAFLSLITLTGCSVVRMSAESFYLDYNSEPQGARIYKESEAIGTTPFRQLVEYRGVQGQRTSMGRFRAIWDGGFSVEKDVVIELPAWRSTPPSISVLFERPSRPLDPRLIDSGCDVTSLPKLPPEQRPSVAVIDFRLAEDLGQGAARALADLARDTVQRSSCYLLLDRENIVAILGEEDFASVVKCDQTSCLVDYGNKLRAQKILSGRVNRVGSSYVVSLTMTDVSTARIEAMKTKTLSGAAERVAEQIPDLACEVLEDSVASNR